MRRASTCIAVATMLGCGRLDFAPLADATTSDAVTDGAALPPGAVLYLPFSAAPAGGLVDDAAGGHTVMCRTTCPTVVAGKHGNAYAFVPTNPDVLVVPYAPDLDPSAGFTIAVWLLMSSPPTSTYFCVLGKPVGTTSFNSHALCVDMAGLAFYHSGTAAGTDNLTGTSVAVGEWHHLAMTWDGTTKRGYLDGVLDGMRDVPVENDTNPISVGADLNAGVPTYALDGSLDEVLVFDRPLGASEIQTLAQ